MVYCSSLDALIFFRAKVASFPGLRTAFVACNMKRVRVKVKVRVRVGVRFGVRFGVRVGNEARVKVGLLFIHVSAVEISGLIISASFSKTVVSSSLCIRLLLL